MSSWILTETNMKNEECFSKTQQKVKMLCYVNVIYPIANSLVWVVFD